MADFQDLIGFLSDGEPIALTAPMNLNGSCMIGFYSKVHGSGCVEVPMVDLLDVARLLYQPVHCPVCVHGLKKIWESLGIGSDGVDVDLVSDTKLMGFLLDPDLEETELNISNLLCVCNMPKYPHRILDIRDKGYPGALHDTLADDAFLIYRLSQELPARMSPELYKLYRQLELPLMLILDQMRRVGIGIDGKGCEQERLRIQLKLKALDKVITRGQSVNLNSDREVFSFLFEGGVRFENRFVYVTRKATTQELEEVAYQYPVVQNILEWRDLRRNLDFLTMAAGHDRIHAIWGQTRAGTSRVYAREPALQNVSRNLRHLFVPAPGHVLVKADYSQAQLRILAHLSGDETLTRLFRDGVDVHGETAQGLNIDRDAAKQVNFGICFGISAGRLAGRISQIRKEQGLPPIDEPTAQTYIDRFYVRYPNVKEFFETEWDRMKNRPKSERVVKSLLGRIRRFNTTASRPVERKFRVTWPQQIEADLIKTSMVRLDRIFKRRRMGARIVMMIHDCIWVECPKAEQNQVRHLMRLMMTTAAKLTVPLEADFK